MAGIGAGEGDGEDRLRRDPAAGAGRGLPVRAGGHGRVGPDRPEPGHLEPDQVEPGCCPGPAGEFEAWYDGLEAAPGPARRADGTRRLRRPGQRPRRPVIPAVRDLDGRRLHGPRVPDRLVRRHRRARLLWTSPAVPGQTCSRRRPSVPDRMVSTNWSPSLTVPTTGWPAGDLPAAATGRRTARRSTSRSRSDRRSTRGRRRHRQRGEHLPGVQPWGGYSLYNGPDDSFATRASRVSFDRPYDRDGAHGVVKSELALIQFAEQAAYRWPI